LAARPATAVGSRTGRSLRQNGVDESFKVKFQDERLSIEWLLNRVEAKVGIAQWPQHYNDVGPKQSEVPDAERVRPEGQVRRLGGRSPKMNGSKKRAKSAVFLASSPNPSSNVGVDTMTDPYQ